MLLFFSVFMVEMVIILMNLIVGLAINNTQEMRQNADGHRLAKEVLLQCYLESLLQVIFVSTNSGSFITVLMNKTHFLFMQLCHCWI